jgi:DNA-binding beta-propeller fold protein YncE
MKLALLLALFTAGAFAAEPEKHYLYLSSPDGAQPGGSGAGILVFDIDNGHRFVKRIDVPSFKDGGVRGFCANAKTHCAYYTTTTRLMGAFDLEAEKVAWEHRYEVGCDRAAVTPDGTKIYVPSGWWLHGDNCQWFVADPADGKVLKSLPSNNGPHNTVASLDGQWVFGGSETTLHVWRTHDDTEVKTISPIGEKGVFPFTVNHTNTRAYVCLGGHVGVEIADLESGKVLDRIMAKDDDGNEIAHRTHGCGLTPDESELWVSDQVGKRLYIFDATVTPPVQKGHVDLSAGGHGWVTFSLDGRYAWCHTPDVIDVKTRAIVATLKDENGNPVCSSKSIEVDFKDGKVVRVGDQFGLGRK